MDEINHTLTSEHNLKDALESITLNEIFEDMRTFIDIGWKENIVTMNDVLSSEVLLFLKRNAEYKEYLSDYNAMNEVEMYVFEQASSNRLDKFWTTTYDRNSVFSAELKHTLNNIIHSVEKEHSLKKNRDDFSRITKGVVDEEKALGISNRLKIELGSSEGRAHGSKKLTGKSSMKQYPSYV
jgi:hypothetical protein